MPRQQCPACQRPVDYCYCHLITPLTNLWPVHIIQDQREASHALGTARMVALTLQACTLTVINPDEESSGRIFPDIPEHAVLIYPGQEAEPVSALQATTPRPLVFIDASWRRSRKILFQYPELSRLPRYALHDEPPSRYRIRKAPSEQSLSTLEAVARTLLKLDPHGADYANLLHVMDRVIDQQIRRMGQSVYTRNYLTKE